MENKTLIETILGLFVCAVLFGCAFVPVVGDSITTTAENTPNNTLSLANSIVCENDGNGAVSLTVDGRDYSFTMSVSQPWKLLAYSLDVPMYLALSASGAVGFWEPTNGFGSTPTETTWSFTYTNGAWTFDNDSRNIHRSGTFEGSVYGFDENGIIGYYNSAYFTDDYPAPHFNKGSDVAIITTGGYWTYSTFASSSDYNEEVTGYYYPQGSTVVSEGVISVDVVNNADGTISINPLNMILDEDTEISINTTSTGLIGSTTYKEPIDSVVTSIIAILPLVVGAGLLLIAITMVYTRY